MKRVCIIGCGAIGSLYAAHLARVSEVWVLVRRKEQAEALNRDGLRVSGTHNFSVTLRATDDPRDSPGLRSRNCRYQGDPGEGVDCWGREAI